ncbi:hypothetical protein CQW23_13480 [Capsicum baccatum]|uniref:Uncharacterized protein n=1 Tax=Capsicum baccatum TaxID=33114 RepID=A0A2G2WVM6_CAPBA|nr:hypothetical protein CQW23_13480 [Capsicum baccatum]
MLVKKDQPCAKEFLKSSDRLTIGELNIINRCDQYTLEGVIVHGLGLVFNSVESALSVRILTLVEQLNNMAKILVKLLSERIIGNVDLAAPPGGDDGDDKKSINIDIRVKKCRLPITQHASTSAYQIMSYFLLDFKLAKDTNLIPQIVGDKDQKCVFYKTANVKDIYDIFRSEVETYLNECVIKGHKLFTDPKFMENAVCPRLHRKLVKSLLMPLVYGWVLSALQRPIFYSTLMFSMVQDYMKMEEDDLVRCKDINMIVNIMLYLLFKYGYPKESKYRKFTIHYSMKTSSSIIPFAIATAITFRERGENQSVRGIVQGYVSVKDEEYSDTVLTEIYLRIYYDENISSIEKNISVEQLALLIEESINDDDVYEPIALRMLDNHKHKYLIHMKRLKAIYKERRGFIIVDIEMFLVEPDTVPGELNRSNIERIHMPYAVGFFSCRTRSCPFEKMC